MAIIYDLQPINQARADYSTAQRNLIAARYEYETALAAYKAKQRVVGDGEIGNTKEQDDLDAAQTKFETARTAATSTYEALQGELESWMSDEATEKWLTAEQDLSRLQEYGPIVLFPVRLETRFDLDQNKLKIRMFPDEIFINTHEIALTDEERSAAESYYTKLNKTEDSEPALWRDLVARFGAPRSAYILRRMMPVFGAVPTYTGHYRSPESCGVTLTGGNNEALTFPDKIDPSSVLSRTSSWTRPGEAVLPDRWIVIAQSAERRLVTWGKRIPEPLAVTMDPNVEEADLVTIAGDLKIDKRILWTVDYDEAVENGMAVSIDLAGTEATNGFDRVIVIGVKSSMGPEDTSRYLETLLDAHHYTRGMALVRQGTPTNNMEGQPTSYPPRDNAAQASFQIERRPAPVDQDYAYQCLCNDCDGTALASVLGIPSGVFTNVDRSSRQEIARAKDMNTLLWSGTIGYFLANMMNPVFTWEQIGNARKFFQQYVLARGPAPAFRIGNTPYGVLPTVSLAQYDASEPLTSDTEAEDLRKVAGALAGPLKSLLDTWYQAADKVPVVRAGQSNPDIDIATVLSTTPSSKQFWVRRGVGQDVNYLHYWFSGWDIKVLHDSMDEQAGKLFGRIGYPNWRPRVGRVQLNEKAWYYNGVVVATQPREDRYLTFLGSLATMHPRNFYDGSQDLAGGGGTLFHKVVRHSLLNEYLYGYLGYKGLLSNWYEREVFYLGNRWTEQTLRSVIFDGIEYPYTDADLDKYAADARRACLNLAGESTAELERLFTETLDLSSHRLDAWITALANRRLDSIRIHQMSQYGTPKGNRLGGYGWLEDVRPRQQTTEVVDGITAENRATNGGFVHTPSLTHAAAAAVLRNAHMSFRQYDKSTYAVDLSSRRVRSARWLFDGVRSGQPLGALLGYQFERGLHENHGVNVELEKFRFKLRNRFPLVAKQSGNDDPDTPSDAIAARNVVDGLRLLRERATLKFGTDPDLPASGSDEQLAIDDELDKLAEIFDAAADMLTAESVFQLVSGNIDAAVPTINNLAEGRQPPPSVFTRSARGGIGIAHKVALVFPADQRPVLGADWPSTLTPRAQAEPVLNAWLGQIIGSPAAISCTLTYFDDKGNPIPNTHDENGTEIVTYAIKVTAKELGLHPLDLLAIATPVAKDNQGAMLDRRIVAAAYADSKKKPDTTPASVKISYTELANSGDRSFPEVLEILSTAGAVLRASRPLAVADLLAPAEVDLAEDETASPNAVAFYDRVESLRTDFLSALEVLRVAVEDSSSGYKVALTGVASYLPFSAFPDPTLSEEALQPAAAAALTQMKRKAGALPTSLTTSERNLTNSVTFIALATQALKGLFGDDFVALPEVEPPRGAELDLSLKARATLLGINNDDAPDKYLQQIARVRERTGRWRKLNLYSRASGLPRPRTDIVQLPYVPGETWLGMKFETPPTAGRSALLLLNYATELDSSENWAGLLLDDWSEVIPNQTEQTGIALHYESPQAQAPQAVLVAVPARTWYNWELDALVDSVEQTLKLTKARGVNLEHLDFGQALPMNMFATVTSQSYDYAVSTIFTGLRVANIIKGLVP